MCIVCVSGSQGCLQCKFTRCCLQLHAHLLTLLLRPFLLSHNVFEAQSPRSDIMSCIFPVGNLCLEGRGARRERRGHITHVEGQNLPRMTLIGLRCSKRHGIESNQQMECGPARRSRELSQRQWINHSVMKWTLASLTSTNQTKPQLQVQDALLRH